MIDSCFSFVFALSRNVLYLLEECTKTNKIRLHLQKDNRICMFANFPAQLDCMCVAFSDKRSFER